MVFCRRGVVGVFVDRPHRNGRNVIQSPLVLRNERCLDADVGFMNVRHPIQIHVLKPIGEFETLQHRKRRAGVGPVHRFVGDRIGLAEIHIPGPILTLADVLTDFRPFSERLAGGIGQWVEGNSPDSFQIVQRHAGMPGACYRHDDSQSCDDCFEPFSIDVHCHVLLSWFSSNC